MLLIGVLLSACGFHLRGAVELPVPMQQTVAQGVAPYSELGLALSQAWRQSGGSLTFDAEQQPDAVRLVIDRKTFTRRTLAVDSAGRPTEYELQYTLGFGLQSAEGFGLVKPQAITLYREYRFDPANALAKSDEEMRIKQEMIRLAVDQMVRRITTQLSNRPPPKANNPETTATPGHETAR